MLVGSEAGRENLSEVLPSTKLLKKGKVGQEHGRYSPWRLRDHSDPHPSLTKTDTEKGSETSFLMSCNQWRKYHVIYEKIITQNQRSKYYAFKVEVPKLSHRSGSTQFSVGVRTRTVSIRPSARDDDIASMGGSTLGRPIRPYM